MPTTTAQIELDGNTYSMTVGVSEETKELDALVGVDFPGFDKVAAPRILGRLNPVLAVTRAQARKEQKAEQEAARLEEEDQVQPTNLYRGACSQ